MALDCYFCSREMDAERPQVPGVTTPICKPCWLHVRDDDSGLVEFHEPQPDTDPYLDIRLAGRFSTEDC